jgi:DNA mismatch endonuclease, patch repair protein
VVDKLTAEKRSWNMSRIKGKNTAPERIVRSKLHKLGYRFRLHPKHLPGKPDLVMPKYRMIVFVNGCFWHRHHCKYAYTPKTRKDFWEEKFKKNIERDQAVLAKLKSLGWNVLTIWECETFDDITLQNRIEDEFRKIHR